MQNKLFNFLKVYPLYVLLLPVFFVLHGYNENFGFIDGKDILLLLLLYCSAAIVVYLLFFLFYRNRIKASLLALYVMSFFLFYGAVKDFLKVQLPFAARYRFLLPLFLLVAGVLLVYIKKTKRSFSVIPLFFNMLLCVYIIVDLAGVSVKAIYPSPGKFSIYSYFNDGKYPLIKNTQKPDIYFLLFDEYASSLSLKENYGFSNNIDSFLLARDFHIQEKGFSNYNYTPASMASILNASYLAGISNNTMLTVEDIGYCTRLVKNNEVIKFLANQGYNIVNYSVFDLAGNPSPVNQALLPLKTRLITDNTFLSRIRKDIEWRVIAENWLNNNTFYKIPEDNQALLQMTKAFSAVKNQQPDFVYAHFYLPHDPFFTDRNGRMRDKKTVMAEGQEKYRSSKSYLEYLVYTNTEIKKLIDTIMANTRGEAVIILMGDHGFREKIESNLHQNYQAMNAVYLPGKDYHLFYDSISSVNQFRVLFNTLFKQSIPLLKDSTIFLSGKE